MNLFKGDLQGLMKNKKMLLLLGGLGVLLMFNPLSLFKGQTPKPAPQVAAATPSEQTSTEQNMSDYEKMYEQRLTNILDQIQGVSDAQVMVTLDSSEENVYAEDMQTDTQTTNEADKTGGTRGITQVDKNGKLVVLQENGQDQPVLLKTIKPRVRGVVVVAKGADQVRAQWLITEAVQGALDVPANHISILPRK